MAEVWQVFGANPRRLARVRSDEAVDYARSFLTSGLTRWREAPLPALPKVEPPLDEVPEALRDVVVTDGFRYRLFDHEKNFMPVAYANLARLKQSSLTIFDRLRFPEGV